ncbi:hypothetical protein ABZW32_34725 [Streptomyces sp. NPDC004667]|uniref:effector-associated constant component EACC1 n=1 Tax=Streptomyces sp. NPDC004667 TaxID=3154285 RepID=UPI0033AB99DC
MTRITMTVTEVDGSAVPDGLRMFINRDSSMRGVGRAEWEPREMRAGELGTGLDILAIVLSTGVGIFGAIDVIKKWCSSQGPAQTVKVMVGSASVTVEGTTNPDEIKRLADALKSAVTP